MKTITLFIAVLCLISACTTQREACIRKPIQGNEAFLNKAKDS